MRVGALLLSPASEVTIFWTVKGHLLKRAMNWAMAQLPVTERHAAARLKSRSWPGSGGPFELKRPRIPRGVWNGPKSAPTRDARSRCLPELADADDPGLLARAVVGDALATDQ